MKRLICLVALAMVVLVRCGVHSTTGTKFSQDQITQIKEGKTTKTQVLEMLGPPMSVNMNHEGKEILTYYSNDMQMAPGVFQREMKMNMQTAQVLVTKEGIVEKVISNTSQTNTKGGVGAQ